MANFKPTSRYSTATVTANRSGKNFIILRNAITLDPDQGDTFVTVTQEIKNRPDLIAQTFYGNTEYWWVIYEFNGIRDPLFELKLGQILRIPAIERVLTAVSKLEE
jgi:nucleoid-associated protein YgaU